MKRYIIKFLALSMLWGTSVHVWALGDYRKELTQAVLSGDVQQVDACLHPVLLPGVIDQLHLLHLAARNGNADILNMLLDLGAAIDVYDARRYTPLHLAAWANQPEVVLLLLLRGADVNLRSGLGITAAEIARRLGHQAVVDIFDNAESMTHGQNPLWGGSGVTLLHYMALEGYMVSAYVLLESGIDPNVQNTSEGNVTPLHVAAAAGHIAMVMLLDNYGANVDAADAHGWTPLHYAALRGYAEVVDCLIGRSANMEAEGSLHRAGAGGYTPLHFAAMRGHEDVVRLLLRRGAHYDVFTDDGQLPELLAWVGGHQHVYDLLVEARVAAETQQESPGEGVSCEDACLGETSAQAVPRTPHRARM